MEPGKSNPEVSLVVRASRLRSRNIRCGACTAITCLGRAQPACARLPLPLSDSLRYRSVRALTLSAGHGAGLTLRAICGPLGDGKQWYDVLSEKTRAVGPNMAAHVSCRRHSQIPAHLAELRVLTPLGLIKVLRKPKADQPSTDRLDAVNGPEDPSSQPEHEHVEWRPKHDHLVSDGP